MTPYDELEGRTQSFVRLGESYEDALDAARAEMADEADERNGPSAVD